MVHDEGMETRTRNELIKLLREAHAESLDELASARESFHLELCTLERAAVERLERCLKLLEVGE